MKDTLFLIVATIAVCIGLALMVSPLIAIILGIMTH